jgi:hypothetical protein
MVDLVTFWLAAWRLRDTFTVSGASLTAGLAFAGSYYLAVHLVFPRRDVDAPDLDLHYLRVKRWVLGILFALFGVQLTYFLTVPSRAAMLASWSAAASVGLFALLLAGAILARERRTNLILLAALVLRYIILLF